MASYQLNTEAENSFLSLAYMRSQFPPVAVENLIAKDLPPAKDDVTATDVDSMVGKYRVEGFTMQDVLDMKAEERMLEEMKYQRIFGFR